MNATRTPSVRPAVVLGLLATLAAPFLGARAVLPEAVSPSSAEAALAAPAVETVVELPAGGGDVAPRGDLEQALLAAAPGLAPEVLSRALDAHACASSKGQLEGSAHPERLAVIDYSLPSTSKRLWVLDLESRTVLFHELVAHGQGTGDNLAKAFSNTSDSHQSSLGVFKTAETYVGKHGRSLRLDGLEPGFNDRARPRAVVVHGADYVSESFARAHGRLGRSWGCPAVSKAVSDALIDAIGGGSLMFAYYPQDAWLQGSGYLSCS